MFGLGIGLGASFLGGRLGITLGGGGVPFNAITLRGERIGLTGQSLTLTKAS